jgi:hypothetical protein
MYTFKGFTARDDMLQSIQRYVVRGGHVGHFLMAVLTNDLREAVNRADGDNLRNLPAYVGYLFNRCPSGCWGSKEMVAAWIEVGGLRGMAEAERRENNDAE